MTDQMFLYSCRDVRKYVYDYRRGDLDDMQSRKFRAHLELCHECRDYVTRVTGMLDAASEFDFAASLDKDDLFSKIAGRIAEPEVDSSAPVDDVAIEVAHEGGDEPARAEPIQLGHLAEIESADDEPPAREGSRTWLYVVAALAAGVLIGLTVPFLIRGPASNAPSPSSAGAPEIAVAPPTAAPGAVESPVVSDLAQLTSQPPPAKIKDVRVFGTPEANWSIRSQGAARKLDLSGGTVLVEFLPKEDASLTVEAASFDVRVTGTLFYVAADRGVVGVVAGSVDVIERDGSVATLTDGQEWERGKGVHAAEDGALVHTNRFVTAEEHRDRLEAVGRADDAPTAEEPFEAARPPTSAEVAATPRDELRAAAELALGEGKHEIAAQYYERMVAELPATEPENASVRLDLARIYIRHLKREHRAAVHLRRFVGDRPTDPATPTARQELCRISAALDLGEQGCGGAAP